MSNDRKLERSICAIFFAIAVIVAIWFRFHQISIKPLHHDEGVNSYFLLNLARNGSYKYDPTNYHGPTLYYFALIAVRLLGETDLALRFWPAIFGVLSVAMIWLLRRHLGPVGTPVAAFFAAISPGLVYFSRDFIHEMSFGCFSLGIIAGALRYAETKEFTWLVLMSISAAMLFATKETAIITVAVIIIALLCAVIWDITRRLIQAHSFSFSTAAKGIIEEFRSFLPSADHASAAIIIFLFINIFFYSSVFTNWQGIIDAGKSISLWTQRSSAEHVKSFWYYFGILVKLELPILAGSMLAGIFVIRRGTRFWLFIAALTLGLALAYSIIGYKTPWLMVSFLIPMAILSGYAAQRLYQFLPLLSLRLLALVIIATAMVFCWRLASKLNFERYDDNSNSSGYFTRWGNKWKLKPYIDGHYGYVYAQTDRDIFNLVESIKDKTDKMPTADHTGINIASPDYWPLPWYLRDYDQVAYSGSLNVLPGQRPLIPQPIVVAGAGQQATLNDTPGWRWTERAFSLRPGVELFLYLNDEPKGNQ